MLQKVLQNGRNCLTIDVFYRVVITKHVLQTQIASHHSPLMAYTRRSSNTCSGVHSLY